jgi:hypothetical protein
VLQYICLEAFFKFAYLRAHDVLAVLEHGIDT